MMYIIIWFYAFRGEQNEYDNVVCDVCVIVEMNMQSEMELEMIGEKKLK